MSMDPTRLTAIPLFSGLLPEEARRLAAFATETSVSEGQILMKEGDFSTELIAIEEGTANVIKGGEVIAELHAGDLIGEMGLLSRELRSADVVATSPMLVIRLTHWEVRRMSAETIAKIEGVIRQRRAAGAADPYQS
jgi:CRP-like cAMP-binding protein